MTEAETLKRPKKKDFEYYQKDLVFKTVNVLEYSKAQDKYIDYLESQLKAKMPSDEAIHTAIARMQAGTVNRNDLVKWIKQQILK